MEKVPPSLMGFWCFNSSSTSRDLIKTVSVILGAYKSVFEGDAAKWKTRKIFNNKDISPSVLRFKPPLLRKVASLELPHPDPDPDRQDSHFVNLLAEEKLTWHSS